MAAVAMVTELGMHVLVLDRSSGGREASLDTHGLMVCLKDMEHSSTDSLVLMAERELNTTVLVMYWAFQSGSQFSLIIQGGGSPSSHCSVTMSNPRIKDLMAIMVEKSNTSLVPELDQGSINLMEIEMSLSIDLTVTTGMVVDRHLVFLVVISTLEKG